MNLKKTAISVALATALTGAASMAQADIIDLSYTGLFTMLDTTGTPMQNTSQPYYGDPTWKYGKRTQISGTMSFNTDNGSGSGTVVPFDFFNSGQAVASGIEFQAIGDGASGPGSLMIGNMTFSWNGSNIGTQIVLDGAGLFAGMQTGALTVGGTINEASCAAGGSLDGMCATAASADIKKAGVFGATPIATSSFNVNGANGQADGTGLSAHNLTTVGMLSLGADDGIGGTPMDNGPFSGANANFDMLSVTMDKYTVTPHIPVPAAVWLFGSGLLGLAGVARRRKQS